MVYQLDDDSSSCRPLANPRTFVSWLVKLPAPYVDLTRALLRETNRLKSPDHKVLFLGTLRGGQFTVGWQPPWLLNKNRPGWLGILGFQSVTWFQRFDSTKRMEVWEGFCWTHQEWPGASLTHWAWPGWVAKAAHCAELRKYKGGMSWLCSPSRPSATSPGQDFPLFTHKISQLRISFAKETLNSMRIFNKVRPWRSALRYATLRDHVLASIYLQLTGFKLCFHCFHSAGKSQNPNKNDQLEAIKKVGGLKIRWFVLLQMAAFVGFFLRGESEFRKEAAFFSRTSWPIVENDSLVESFTSWQYISPRMPWFGGVLWSLHMPSQPLFPQPARHRCWFQTCFCSHLTWGDDPI